MPPLPPDPNAPDSIFARGFREHLGRLPLAELVDVHEDALADIARIENDLGLARRARKEVAARLAGRLLDETPDGVYQRPGLTLKANLDRNGVHRIATDPRHAGGRATGPQSTPNPTEEPPPC